MQVVTDFATVDCPMPKPDRAKLSQVPIIAITASRYWLDDIARGTGFAES
jgi:hypothetical protein